MKNPDLSLDETYVLFGVGRKEKGFGHSVAATLEQKGHSFFIVHPDVRQIGAWSPVAHVSELPVTPDAAILCSPKDRSRQILEELFGNQVQRVYATPGSMDDAGRAYAQDHGMEVIEECPLLHVGGLGFPHNLHRGILELFGR